MGEKKLEKVWLHKSLTESKLFTKNSVRYKEALKNGWNEIRAETIHKDKYISNIKENDEKENDEKEKDEK